MMRSSLGLAVFLGCGVAAGLAGPGCGGAAPAVTVPAPAPVVSAEVAAPKPPPAPEALAPPQPTLRLPRNFLPTRLRGAARRSIRRAPGSTARSRSPARSRERSSVIWLHGRQLTVTARVRAPARRRGRAHRDAARRRAAGAARRARRSTPGSGRSRSTTPASSIRSTRPARSSRRSRGAPYVYTQFEAMYARRVFPCFDEPDNKVPWQLTLDVPARAGRGVATRPIVREAPLRRRQASASSSRRPSRCRATWSRSGSARSSASTPARPGAARRSASSRSQGRAADAAWAAQTSAKLLDLLEELLRLAVPVREDGHARRSRSPSGSARWRTPA